MYKLEDIKTILIAGSGIMGSSFAQIFAREGYEVILYDIYEKALEQAVHMIEVGQQAQIEQNRISEEKSKELISRIHTTSSKDCFTKAEFVLEAVVERMDIKHAFWAELSEVISPEAILATNTSGLPVTRVAEAVKDPGRFAGMHWVNPPHLIPLVEVIAGEKSNQETIDVIYSLAQKIQQKPIRVYHDPQGFILNRLQYSVIREACNCVAKGYASLEDVDNVMKYGLGMRYAAIGPFETIDFGNIETFYNVATYLYKDLCNDTGVPPLLDKVYHEGKLGIKNGSGFYDYSGDKADKALARRDKMFIRLYNCLFGEDE
ncbi:MAG: 3-hydroxyacyl-CoA dehydrogenase family protein [Clostridia bacterium]|nr:3-hydroxyacyl-CoA dehydrogenase family protein [Clostridia bacterium]